LKNEMRTNVKNDVRNDREKKIHVGMEDDHNQNVLLLHYILLLHLQDKMVVVPHYQDRPLLVEVKHNIDLMVVHPREEVLLQEKQEVNQKVEDDEKKVLVVEEKEKTAVEKRNDNLDKDQEH